MEGRLIMPYKFKIREAMPDFYTGNPEYPVMDACIEFLRGIHDEDLTFEDESSFNNRLERYPHFLRERGVENAEKERLTNPTLAPSHGLERAYSIFVVSELSYVPGKICWIGNLVPEDMMKEFYEWVEMKERMSRSMISMRAGKPD
jgi:hypothetical protein